MHLVRQHTNMSKRSAATTPNDGRERLVKKLKSNGGFSAPATERITSSEQLQRFLTFQQDKVEQLKSGMFSKEGEGVLLTLIIKVSKASRPF